MINENIIKWDMSPDEIEEESFRRIELEADRGAFTDREWRVVRRLIHTTANFSVAGFVKFADDPVAAGIAAMKDGAPIYCDSNMIRSGISVAKLKKFNPAYERDSICCLVDNKDVAAESARIGHTRALIAVEKARHVIDGGIVLIGNAPLALAKLALMIGEGIRPRLVIGMPVGFVNVVESKKLIMQTDVPRIVVEGRLGGSTMAVAALHAIMESDSCLMNEA